MIGRVLGIDYGRKRIGVACTDPLGITVQPIAAFEGEPAAALEPIRKECIEREVDRVVVGLPLNMDGSEGPAAKRARTEAERLATVVGVPVEMHDERRTTVSADRSMLDAGLNAIERRQRVDKVAAAIMLQSWLDARRHRVGREEAAR